MTPPAVCLTIAGIDSSGGAGVLMDVAMIRLSGSHPAAVISATTAQNSTGVHDVHLIPPRHLKAQLDAVFSDMDVRAVKTGMLADSSTISVVAEALSGATIPVVVDPVMVATSGSALTVDDTIAALQERLIPCATLLTPNIPEAERLLHAPIRSFASPEEMALVLAERTRTAVLLKGGHGEGETILDVLATPETVTTLKMQRRKGTYHGTGCALSAAIASLLGQGVELLPAVKAARTLLVNAIDGAFRPGHSEMLYLKV
ncbi:MAG TPA: bifunctional hydroxymethylpyrimidine kinase/phosphomethylpyrimidine kinase [Thermoanaerobaculia bacterium]|nr:bifunctional hydroxymethylpyrimidine kinase/phosphomethylpyrimidine kinase [Thermoanaerobaculia bacterium]HUM29090.1 bifunctional hydroxymethylpyrimidine kinase/phosphomethylpyrimidine kinase [Thermoanaerobaculia bacterium]HXK67467.1 bifunctional hydroxymethylpyrimidine kinase/phosphomethylpyrimidine kinase [Thermoanaerobaculia bacterium]